MERPVHGDPLHTRSLSYSAYATQRGGLRVHADIIDLRKSGFIPMGADFQAAGIIHQMEIDLELDSERRLTRLDVSQPVVAIEASEASNNECCRDPAPALQALVGSQLDDDFAKRLSKVAGGALGCSHIVTLFQLIASGLPPSLDFESERRAADGHARTPGERIANRSLYVDGFDAGESIQLWVRVSDIDTTPLSAVRKTFERLARLREVRLVAEVAAPEFRLHTLSAETRERDARTFSDTTWLPLDAEVDDLEGIPMMGGFARELFQRFGKRPALRPLLDALLNLAPGFIQVMAAFSDRAMATPSTEPKGLPNTLSLGGREGSCYMWRSDSPLLHIRKDDLGH